MRSNPRWGFFIFFYFSFFCNRQPDRLGQAGFYRLGWITAKPILFCLVTPTQTIKNRLSKPVGLAISFAVSGFWTNVGNPTVWSPGNPAAFLTVFRSKFGYTFWNGLQPPRLRTTALLVVTLVTINTRINWKNYLYPSNLFGGSAFLYFGRLFCN